MSDLNVYYTVILKDGAIISIRSDGFRDPRILALLKREGWRGDERFYISSSRGIIPIKEMQSTHLRNAILKIHKEWLENLYKISDPIRFCREFITGCSDKTYIALVEELATRRA